MFVADCSKRCQEAHWARHKGECTQLRQQAEQNRMPEDQVYGTARNSSGGAGARSSGSASGSGNQGAEEPRLVRPMCGLCGNRKVRWLQVLAVHSVQLLWCACSVLHGCAG